MQKSPVVMNRQHKGRRAIFVNTIALIGGLCVLVVAQFVLFPLLFTVLIDNPLERGPLPQSVQSSLGDFSALSLQKQQQQHEGRVPNQKPLRDYDLSLYSDGTFNGAPLRLTTDYVQSHVHCVGDNFRPNHWKYKSCRFHFLCMNQTSQEFLVFDDTPDVQRIHSMQREFMMFSSFFQRDRNHTQSISVGGINQKWSGSVNRLEWFPSIQSSRTLTYYMLPDSIVLTPFHSMNGANPGHLVWDDFLPIYNLLDMFQLHDHELLLLRYVFLKEKGLWASCDVRPSKQEECKFMMNKFLPLMVGLAYTYKLTSTNETEFRPKYMDRSELVCAKTAVAGIGPLTDHGVIKMHGWEEEDYDTTHNYGRGGLFYTFRNFMVQNLGLPVQSLPKKSPHRIVFSQKSSDIGSRNVAFHDQIALVKEKFPNELVENFTMKSLSLRDQIQIASEASIYISLCGGGAVTAMFLPKGASVILYFSEDGGYKQNAMTFKPARLDWDVFNHMSHLRVHWMPRNTMRKQQDKNALVDLIRHELDLIEGGYFE